METNLSVLIGENPEWQLTLQAYLAAEEQAAEHQQRERAAAKLAAAEPAKSPASPVGSPAADSELDQPGETSPEESGPEERQRKLIWVRRIREVDGVPVDRLAPIHGRLIAEGLIHFSLSGREEGVLYRLTREARQVLAALPEVTAEPVSEAAAEADAPIPAAA